MLRLFSNIFQKRNRLISVFTCLIIFCIILTNFYIINKDSEYEKLKAESEAIKAVDAFEVHTALIINQIDILLHAVRITFINNSSISVTEMFINSLNIDTSVTEDIFIVDSHGNFIIPYNNETKMKNVTDRDYYKYHLNTPEDNIYISSVEKGYISNKYRFRITRRINNIDGSFGGIIIATINPKSFTHYYNELKIGKQNVTILVGLQDKKLRARIPEPQPEIWNREIKLPLFDTIGNNNSGNFEYQSEIDNIKRFYVYKKIHGIPLSIVVGFSYSDLTNRLDKRKKLLLIVSSISTIFIITISLILLNLFKANDKLKIISIKLKDLSIQDQLTNCFNRRYLDTQMNNEIIRAQRFEYSLSIIMCDIDFFKTINDTYGHMAGDIILKDFSAILLNGIRKNIDYVTRYGGDEFLVVLPKTNLSGATILAERYRAQIEKETFKLKKNIIKVTASFGVVSKNYTKYDKSYDKNEFITLADNMLYEAKSSGRNCIISKELL